MVKVLQCQIGTDELNHGNERFIVDNRSWRVQVPDHIAHFFISDGRAGVRLVTEGTDDSTILCPNCHSRLTFRKET